MGNYMEVPECISVIICDDIYRDETTKKLVIVGTFNTIFCNNLPARHRKISILFSLTNGKGTYKLSLRIEHAKTGAIIANVNGPLEMKDPLQIADINVAIENLVFPEFGKYWVTIDINGRIINQRPFLLVKTEKGA